MNASLLTTPWQLAIGTLVAEDLRPDVIAYNSAITSCRAKWQAAWYLLGVPGARIQPNVRSYGAAASSVGDWAKAKVLLDDMARCQVISNQVTLNTCARACRLAGQWRQVLGSWNQGHQPDLISLTLVVGASEQANRWDLALQCLDLAAGMQPDLMFYNTIMSACVAADQWRDVLHLLGARASKNSLSTVSFNLAITAVNEGAGGQCDSKNLVD